MNCKRIRFLMEMIFIFILPLLFILPNFSIKNDIVYDNNGNYEISNKSLQYNNTLIKYTKIGNYIPNVNATLIVNSDYYDFTFENNDILSYDLNNNINNVIDLLYFYNQDYESFQFKIIYNLNQDKIYFLSFSNFDIPLQEITLVEKSINNNILRVKFGFIQLFAWREHDIDINIILSNKSDNAIKNINTIWGNIKELLVNYAELNENVLTDLLLSYTMLWFVMFIIWHLFYLLIDFLLHFWRKEDN